MFLKGLKKTAENFLKHYKPRKDSRKNNENHKPDSGSADSNTYIIN